MIISITLEYECQLVTGDGLGTSDTKIGPQTGYDCIRACVELKKTNNNVNGVTVLANNDPGSYCLSSTFSQGTHIYLIQCINEWSQSFRRRIWMD